VPRFACLAVVVVVGLAGCGADEEHPNAPGPSADQQVRTVVAKFGIATQKQDYQEICDHLLSATLIDKLETVGLPCEGALQRGLSGVKAPTLQITKVAITGDTAVVSVHTTAEGQEASDDALQLAKEGGAWKIASLDTPTGTQTSTAPTPTTTATTPTTTNGDD
jgi:hypothetical protein